MTGFFTASIGWILLLAIFGLYSYGLITAIDLSWTGDIPEGKYPEALSTAINSMQALLLTNLGALLGIAVTNPASAIARTLKLRSASSAAQGAALPAPPNPLNVREYIQLAALIIYVLGLIACTIGWGHDDFSSDSKHVIDVVSTSGKMLIGVALAYLTAVLQSSPNP